MKIYKTEEQNYFVDVDKNGVYFIVPIYMADNLQGSYEMAHVAIQMQKENGADAPFKGDVSKLEDFTPEAPYPFSFEPDFYEFKGTVKDQYGELIDKKIVYSIEGTDKAKIQEGVLIEEEVQEDTPYTIVAKVGKLEKKEERTLYKREKPKPLDPENAPVTRAEYEELKAALEAMLGGEK